MLALPPNKVPLTDEFSVLPKENEDVVVGAGGGALATVAVELPKSRDGAEVVAEKGLNNGAAEFDPDGLNEKVLEPNGFEPNRDPEVLSPDVPPEGCVVDKDFAISPIFIIVTCEGNASAPVNLVSPSVFSLYSNLLRSNGFGMNGIVRFRNSINVSLRS